MFAKSPWMLALACCLSWAGLAQALETQRWQTPQGAQVVFVPSRDNPLLDVRVDFDAGNRRDSASKPGAPSTSSSSRSCSRWCSSTWSWPHSTSRCATPWS